VPVARPVPALLGAVLALGLAACGTGAAEQTAPSPSPATRTVESFRGPVEVPANPERVVVLDTGELDSAVALGVTPVGAVRAPVQDGLLGYLADELDGVELVGEIGEPDLERIAALDPDVILGSELRVGEVYDQLSAIAPTVLTETVGVVWKENLLVHGAALGREQEARALLDAYEARADEVAAAVDDATTVSVVRFVPGEIRLYAHENFLGTVLSDIDAARPAPQDVAEFAVTVSPEQIDQAAGDVVLVGTYGDPAETDRDAVLGGPLWERTVAGSRVEQVSDDLFFLGIGVGAAQQVLDELERLLG
jgi:iron complex transport system substrate-binding protein